MGTVEVRHLDRQEEPPSGLKSYRHGQLKTVTYVLELFCYLCG